MTESFHNERNKNKIISKILSPRFLKKNSAVILLDSALAFYNTPLVLGSWLMLRGSRCTAILMARAKALKVASIL